MGRNVPVYASIGNHEAVPTNLFAANGNELNSETVQKTAQLYENMARFWSPWLDEEQLATVRSFGLRIPARQSSWRAFTGKYFRSKSDKVGFQFCDFDRSASAASTPSRFRRRSK